MDKTTQLSTPGQRRHNVVIVGGAMFGASVAWFHSDNPDFDGSLLVVDRDPSYARSSTMATNSCMRQQFSREVNVKVSQFAADFMKNLPRYLGDDPRVPKLIVQSYPSGSSTSRVSHTPARLHPDVSCRKALPARRPPKRRGAPA